MSTKNLFYMTLNVAFTIVTYNNDINFQIYDIFIFYQVIEKLYKKIAINILYISYIYIFFF